MRDHITSEVGETLEIVAREVVLELTLPESVRVESLSPFRVEQGERAAPGSTSATCVSGQVLTIVLRLTFDFGVVGPRGRRRTCGSPTATARSRRPAPPWSRRRWPGSTPTTRPTTRSRATWRWTASWPACSRSARSRRPCGSTARAATTMRAGSSAPSGTASAATPAVDGELNALRRGALRGAGPLRGADAGDGPQGGLLRVQQPVPDAHVGGEVAQGLTVRGAHATRPGRPAHGRVVPRPVARSAGRRVAREVRRNP